MHWDRRSASVRAEYAGDRRATWPVGVNNFTGATTQRESGSRLSTLPRSSVCHGATSVPAPRLGRRQPGARWRGGRDPGPAAEPKTDQSSSAPTLHRRSLDVVETMRVSIKLSINRIHASFVHHGWSYTGPPLRTARDHRRAYQRAQPRRPRFQKPMLTIHDRPFPAVERSEAGHRGEDLIIGHNHLSAIGTLLERPTRMLRAGAPARQRRRLIAGRPS